MHGTALLDKVAILIWEFMDNGVLEIENDIPQGPLSYLPDGRGRMVLYEK